jgi:hypothetical protein
VPGARTDALLYMTCTGQYYPVYLLLIIVTVGIEWMDVYQYLRRLRDCRRGWAVPSSLDGPRQVMQTTGEEEATHRTTSPSTVQYIQSLQHLSHRRPSPAMPCPVGARGQAKSCTVVDDHTAGVLYPAWPVALNELSMLGHDIFVSFY